MGLENIFEQAEKPIEEKKLQLVNSQDGVIEELSSYFKKQKKYASGMSLDYSKDFFSETIQILQAHAISPQLVNAFNKNMRNNIGFVEYWRYGVFLSAMMQTSYNQGNNDFEFDFVTAEGFASFLHGEEQNLLRITLKALYGNDCLGQSSFCFLKAGRMFEGPHMYKAQHCILEAEKNEVLTTFYNRKNCRVKIGHARYLDKKDEKS
ncbi:hypothetical protein HY643_00620 [Candidatus Woesearchaeota archaeon]|nr:hypothetical protein [Candidatus Woesearchaeota archaeon]